VLTTDGWLLDGRVRYAQPLDGYRTGIEPVLLAASIPARAGERVLEAGTGAGAGLLCLASRVPGVLGLGIELDPAMAELARQNVAANGIDGISIATADIGAWCGDRMFDHAFSNPPWHDPADTLPPGARRRLATHEGDVPLEGWIAALRAVLRPTGSLTVLAPARQAARIMAALQAEGFGRLVLFPLWPKPGRDAKLALMRGHAAQRGPGRIAPGLVLHDADGRFSGPAQSLLRDRAALPI
jgi:tRNA1Val (adenine37-N6)-methyltransferase